MSKKISRREIIKRAAYVAPAILTLAAVPAFASGGSGGKTSSSSSWSSDN
jgi:hypothetical protein